MGFYSAYKGVANMVKEQVDRLLNLHKTAKIVVTGHSLGGAMAVLAALDLKVQHGKVDYLYTYGQPRVGNQAFADYLQAQVPATYRVINYADTVPHVPPSAFSFKHGGHEMWYNPRGMATYKQCVSEDKNCANSIPATSMSTDDHNLSVYMTLKVGSSSASNIRRESEADKYTEAELMEIEKRKVEQIK